MSDKNINDPFQKREASKYANPVPSREFILEFLASENSPVGHEAMCAAFQLTKEDEIEALRRRLIAMARDHQLNSFNDEYRILEATDLFEGRVQGNKEGHGFLLRQNDEDIFLSARQMQNAMDGDLITVRLTGRTVKGRLDGIIVEVLERKHQRVVGRYYEESQVSFVTPENPRIPQDILIGKESGLTPTHGQYVVIELLTFPEKGQAATGVITQILGDFMAPGLEIDIAIHKYDIPNEWPAAVSKHVANIGFEVAEQDKEHRVDLRGTPFVTIDGEDARDFDDAVYCEKTPGGWKLFVAIADVSHYVKKGTALDAEAIIRGNSVYFPGRVVPMLPEVLSNGLCSLNPDVDRLVMVAEISLTTRGKMRGYKFYEGIIRSHARLTYSKVAKMISTEMDEQGEELRSRYASIVQHIDALSGLYSVLKGARAERGAMEFDTVETRMVFDQDSKIEQIVPVERNDAHKLIEECMLCANVAAAEFLFSANIPALFRVHEGPKEERLLTLRTYLAVLGLELGGGLKPTPDDYALLSQQIQGRADARSIQTMMLRSMSQAVYQADNQGHFGLNYTGYTHFTSPIRRYPDLLVHRAIRYLIRGEGRPKLRQAHRVPNSPEIKQNKIYGYDDAQMDDLGTSCSMTERRADEATRDVEAWLKCQYVEQHTGETFDGVVTAVTPFGLFVELKDLFVDGLVHISSLGKDYFVHDPDMQSIIGERTGRVFRLGDALKIVVAKVNLDQRKIDLELEQDAAKVRRPKPQKRDELTELEMQLAQLPSLELGGRAKRRVEDVETTMNSVVEDEHVTAPPTTPSNKSGHRKGNGENTRPVRSKLGKKSTSKKGDDGKVKAKKKKKSVIKEKAKKEKVKKEKAKKGTKLKASAKKETGSSVKKKSKKSNAKSRSGTA
ncbi:ribonuclease R [Marinomonas sp. 2405UD68-3]|uniref:ribonuclease R n=1 Tax=Marinomonas sp. 2405UD68-3 TaxID=3391835 RepID=UPI0039C90251